MNAQSILFVDQDPNALRLIESVVGPTNIGAFYAENAVAALQLLRFRNCSTLVTSLIMPGMNGYELSLLARQRFPELEVFLAAEVISPEVCHLAADVGISRVFSKPWTTERIGKVVEAATWEKQETRSRVPRMLRQPNALW
ncbi:MAG TPA: response regulator [Geomonas sp.]|nr:response regulator [Geomonas sp.]